MVKLYLEYLLIAKCCHIFIIDIKLVIMFTSASRFADAAKSANNCTTKKTYISAKNKKPIVVSGKVDHWG